MRVQKTRCKYTKDGLRVFKMQKYGYAWKNTGKNGGINVVWDGEKTVKQYSEDFIDMNIFNKLFIEEEDIELDDTLMSCVADIINCVDELPDGQERDKSLEKIFKRLQSYIYSIKHSNLSKLSKLLKEKNSGERTEQGN